MLCWTGRKVILILLLNIWHVWTWRMFFLIPFQQLMAFMHLSYVVTKYVCFYVGLSLWSKYYIYIINYYAMVYYYQILHVIPVADFFDSMCFDFLCFNQLPNWNAQVGEWINTILAMLLATWGWNFLWSAEKNKVPVEWVHWYIKNTFIAHPSPCHAMAFSQARKFLQSVHHPLAF